MLYSLSMPGILRDSTNSDLTRNLPGPTYVQGIDGLPTVAERLEDPVLPAIEENLVCIAGCRHYLEWLVDSSDMGTGRELQRFCRKFSTATELMDLSDGAVFACSGFAPCWWSLRALRRWIKSRKLLKDARDRIAERDTSCVGTVLSKEDSEPDEEIIILN